MRVDMLEHINIRCADVERCKDFYEKILGLTIGPRPPFASHGYWFYIGDHPYVHIVQKKPDEDPAGGAGAMDHVAFRGLDLKDMKKTLDANGIAYREAVVPRDGTVQLFVKDPEGVGLELNFPIAAQ